MRELIEVHEVNVIFGCWTSVSRKAVLPVVEELNGLLFFPVQYEGEESSKKLILHLEWALYWMSCNVM